MQTSLTRLGVEGKLRVCGKIQTSPLLNIKHQRSRFDRVVLILDTHRALQSTLPCLFATLFRSELLFAFGSHFLALSCSFVHLDINWLVTQSIPSRLWKTVSTQISIAPNTDWYALEWLHCSVRDDHQCCEWSHSQRPSTLDDRGLEPSTPIRITCSLQHIDALILLTCGSCSMTLKRLPCWRYSPSCYQGPYSRNRSVPSGTNQTGVYRWPFHGDRWW